MSLICGVKMTYDEMTCEMTWIYDFHQTCLMNLTCEMSLIYGNQTCVQNQTYDYWTCGNQTCETILICVKIEILEMTDCSLLFLILKLFHVSFLALSLTLTMGIGVDVGMIIWYDVCLDLGMFLA